VAAFYNFYIYLDYIFIFHMALLALGFFLGLFHMFLCVICLILWFILLTFKVVYFILSTRDSFAQLAFWYWRRSSILRCRMKHFHFRKLSFVLLYSWTYNPRPHSFVTHWYSAFGIPQAATLTRFLTLTYIYLSRYNLYFSFWELIFRIENLFEMWYTQTCLEIEVHFPSVPW